MIANPHRAHVVLLLLAFVFFVIAAVGVPTNRINMIGLGLAFWVLDALIPLL